MPGIGNCDGSQVIAALRYYDSKLEVGEWVVLPQHPHAFERHKFYFPLRQWEHATRAARRLAMVSVREERDGRRFYRIRKPVWETVRVKMVAMRRFKAGSFDNWILSAEAERGFEALPLFWKCGPAREFLGEHESQFLARTRAFWEGATGRKVVEVHRPKSVETTSPKAPGTDWQPAHNTLQWKLRGFFKRT